MVSSSGLIDNNLWPIRDSLRAGIEASEEAIACMQEMVAGRCKKIPDSSKLTELELELELEFVSINVASLQACTNPPGQLLGS